MRKSRNAFASTFQSLFVAGVAGLALTTAWSMAAPAAPAAPAGAEKGKQPTKLAAKETNESKESKDVKQPTSPLDFTVKDIDGKETNLSQYKGKVVMIVNVASRCGFTPQYTGLEAVYKKYADRGFVILGFPANNFGGQEPGSNEEIKQFCSAKYDVTFPMMSKISVKGDDKAPVYKFLTEKGTAGNFAGDITWNFNKYVIGRDGNIIARYDSKTKPEDAKVTSEIEKALDAKPAEKTAEVK